MQGLSNSLARKLVSAIDLLLIFTHLNYSHSRMMKAMVLQKIGQPLQLVNCEIPEPSEHEVLVKVLACGVCRTDLHIIDGELPNIHTPIIPGHEIVGVVYRKGGEVPLDKGELVGIPWLGKTCGSCWYCNNGYENLCDHPQFTGYQINGGFCEYTLADHRYVIPLEKNITPENTAPLLCAGLIGYRSFKMAKASSLQSKKIGIYGFGAAAHILSQIIVKQGLDFYAFTRSDDTNAQNFAKELGAKWAGSSDASPPDKLDIAILFAPVGPLIPKALRAVRKGGVVVCGGIHMSDIPSFPYAILWGERQIRSVANLTRKDGIEFFNLVENLNIDTHIETFPLEDANQAIDHLRQGNIKGAAVLIPN